MTPRDLWGFFPGIATQNKGEGAILAWVRREPFAVAEAWEKREGRIAGRRREERQARPWRGTKIALRRCGIEAVAGVGIRL
jgi:hypothetical protein